MKQEYKIGQKILVRSPVDTLSISKDKIYTGTIVEQEHYGSNEHIPFRIEGTRIQYAVLKGCAHIDFNDWIVIISNKSLLTNITKFLRRVLHV